MIAFFPPYIISLLIGWQILTIFFKNTNSRPLLLNIFLSVGLGLGVSAQITFYLFLILGQFHPPVILAVHLLLLLVLFIINRQSLAASFKNSFPAKNFPLDQIGIGLFFLLMLHVIYIIASSQPWGRWDAWAVWNMKTKFLIYGKDSWADIFKLHWHTQPDYPLLVPFMNTWVFAVVQKNFNFIPALTAIIFTASCAGLLYAGLVRYIPNKIAFLSAASLLILPIYTISGTSQYADIEMAYYLLASVILLTVMLREKHPGAALFLGVNLGFLCFTKNEGIAVAAILALIAGAGLLTERVPNKNANLKILYRFLLGLFIACLPTLILKLHLAPPNRDIGLSFFHAKHEFFNLQGCWLIIQGIARSMLDGRFSLLWPLFLILFLLQPRRYFAHEVKALSLFFILYWACIILVYLTTINFDLQWRISRTLVRVLLTQLPALMFLHFYVYWRKDN